MKILTTFKNAIDANIAKGLLESHGISSALHDDSINQLMPVQGVKLSVDAQHLDEARAILIDHDLLTE